MVAKSISQHFEMVEAMVCYLQGNGLIPGFLNGGATRISQPSAVVWAAPPPFSGSTSKPPILLPGGLAEFCHKGEAGDGAQEKAPLAIRKIPTPPQTLTS